jgi:hypothetical protein
MANKVLGMHRLKNKVNRNAFDLSHRHMFTAQVGELLPVFTQWVNPNETFKIGYNGKTRTAALNTDAFTRIRENIQYYFVPFQSLWKFFEQQVNNMTKGDAGQNISKFADSSTSASQISTSLPYISYVDLASWLQLMLMHILLLCLPEKVRVASLVLKTFVILLLSIMMFLSAMVIVFAVLRNFLCL